MQKLQFDIEKLLTKYVLATKNIDRIIDLLIELGIDN